MSRRLRDGVTALCVRDSLTGDFHERVTTIRVRSLGFAEVKGTAILPHERIRVEPSGVTGGWRFAAVEVGDGAVLRTVRDPALPAVRARCDGSTLELGFPDSSHVTQPLEVGRRWGVGYWGR